MRALVALVLAALVSVGCDSNVGGVKFESGFGVSRDQAAEEGYQAGWQACKTEQRTGKAPVTFAKYKSSSKASEFWSEGYYSGVHAAGCRDL